MPLAARLKISPVLSFLAAGVLLGPTTLASLTEHAPLIKTITINSPDTVSSVAEIGIVFLLFLIGLELSFERLTMMRRTVFGMGSLQLVVTAGGLAGALALGGFAVPVAVLLGLGACLASTAIIVEMMAGRSGLPAMSAVPASRCYYCRTLPSCRSCSSSA